MAWYGLLEISNGGIDLIYHECGAPDSENRQSYHIQFG